MKSLFNQFSHAEDIEADVDNEDAAVNYAPPYRLGPEDCTLALPKLCSLLPDLSNLQDLESVQTLHKFPSG